MGGIIAAIITGSLGGLIWWLAVKDVEAEKAKELERMGGFDVQKTPWANQESVYSPEQIALMKAYPNLSEPTHPPVSAPVSAPVSEASLYVPEPLVPPAVPPVATTTYSTGGGSAVELTGEAWLRANEHEFPVKIPSTKIESFADRKKYAEAVKWITRAIDAGISQNKTAMVVFCATKNSDPYRTVVDLYKEVKGNV